MRRLLALTLLLATALATALVATLARAQDLLPLPPLSARVIDQTATLSEPQRAALEAKLAAFEAEAGPQIVVLMVPTTAPEDIADYTQRLGEAWKIGRREVGDGVLVVVAKDQRRVRISPAKALEGAIPDLAARQIIDRHIAPAFREGDYAGGLDAAVDALIARIRGEELPAPARQGRGGSGGPGLEQLLMFFFVGVTVLSSVMTALFGRKLGALLTGGAAGGLAWWISASVLIGVGVGIAALVLIGIFGIGAAARGIGGGRELPHIGGWGGGYGGGRGGWSGGRGGGGFGGGGFRSGGGGNFGGGGASGSW
jgi:uncharacterized protein